MSRVEIKFFSFFSSVSVSGIKLNRIGKSVFGTQSLIINFIELV